MKELITVVVPVYRVENYLSRCIDSIIKQTYKNLEIILVEDGSPDRCGEICDEYASIDKRVKVIHKKNGGLSDARNAGIEIAQGEYVAFVDSDDWISEEYIERLYKLLKKTDADIAVCDFLRTSTENIEVDTLKEDIYEYSNVEALKQLTGEFYVQMVIACGKLYKMNLFQDIRFPVGRIHEDEFTTYKLIYKAKKIVLTTAQLLYYWQREDSIMGTGFNIKNRLDAIDAFDERAFFFKEVGMKELSDKTYKLLFFMYLTINSQIHRINSTIYQERFNNNYNKFKNNLRKSCQKFSFKIFYELYFINANTMYFVYIIYRKLRQL